MAVLGSAKRRSGSSGLARSELFDPISQGVRNMTAVTPVPIRPFDDSTDSLLRFAMRLDATLSGVIGLFIALMADTLSALTGLSSIAEFSVGALLVFGGLAVYGLAAAPDLRRVGMGLIVANAVLT